MRKDTFNFRISSNLETVGKYEMPQIKAFDSKNLSCKYLIATPFNYAITEIAPESKVCHFYLDDYQFERVWREPETYVEILKKFNAVIGADFSIYSNLPLPQQIYNNWRNKVLMAYWQKKGIKVIPNVQWSDEKSFDFSFDGYSPGGTVAISSTGCQFKEAKENFIKGYNKMCEEIKPDEIICIGKVPTELENDKRLIYIPSFMENRRKIWAEEEVALNHKIIQ